MLCAIQMILIDALLLIGMGKLVDQGRQTGDPRLPETALY
jgi:hypothetical protein